VISACRGVSELARLFSPLVFPSSDSPLSAQAGRSERLFFLKLILSAQQGEKLEHEKTDLSCPGQIPVRWKPDRRVEESHSIGSPRSSNIAAAKIGEGILQEFRSAYRDTMSKRSCESLPEIVPSLPENDALTEPGSEVVAHARIQHRSPKGPAMERFEGKQPGGLRRKVDQLTDGRLEKQHGDLEIARKEKKPSVHGWRKQDPRLRTHKGK